MNPKVLRRFIVYLAIATLLMFTVWTVFQEQFERQPGDYYTELGGNRLKDGRHDEALDHFAKALDEAPNHRGALMGRALVFIDRQQYDLAVSELTFLIEFLETNLETDDRTGRAALAAAYANRGIVNDREGRHEKALADYIEALKTDSGAVEGPGWVDKLLYGDPDPATIRGRAKYIHEQLKLPENERVMRVPEIDAEQRPYKPR